MSIFAYLNCGVAEIIDAWWLCTYYVGTFDIASIGIMFTVDLIMHDIPISTFAII